MFKVKTEGFSKPETAAITSLTTEVAALAKKAASGHLALRKTWFGAAAETDDLVKNLKRMDEYLNGKCVLITYVRKNVGHQVDSAPVEDSDYGQVIPNVGRTTANFRTTEWHVSGGIRVYAMNEYFRAVKDGDREEMVNYVYHEISHKVLDTVDYRYGPSKCKALAIASPKKAVRNADNYGYFIAAVDAAG